MWPVHWREDLRPAGRLRLGCVLAGINTTTWPLPYIVIDDSFPITSNMHFTLTAALALAAATIASAGRHVRVSSHDACKLYQGMSGGGYIYGNDGWGEASHFVILPLAFMTTSKLTARSGSSPPPAPQTLSRRSSTSSSPPATAGGNASCASTPPATTSSRAGK